MIDRVESPSLTRQRKTFFAPIWLLAAVAAISLIVAIATLAYYQDAATTTIIVIRHAEKQLGKIQDPPLSPAGVGRADRLALVLGGQQQTGRISAIYITSKLRSKQTADPLAKRLGLAPRVADDGPKVLASRVLREQGGKVSLVVGHSNTVPDIVRTLAGTRDVPEMDEDMEFDTMYVVSVPPLGAASVVRMRY
jgi:broad specificity phosphatase PhoE